MDGLKRRDGVDWEQVRLTRRNRGIKSVKSIPRGLTPEADAERILKGFQGDVSAAGKSVRGQRIRLAEGFDGSVMAYKEGGVWFSEAWFQHVCAIEKWLADKRDRNRAMERKARAEAEYQRQRQEFLDRKDDDNG